MIAVMAGLLALLPLNPSHAAVDQTPPAIVAVMDMQRILQESLAAKNVQQQLESQRAHFQTQIESEENELRKTEDDLSKARDQLPAAAYSEREQQLRRRFLEVEAHVEARRKTLDQAFTDSMNKVRVHLMDIVAKVAHAHGANLVIVKQQTVWADDNLDITGEVLDQLNRQLSQVPIAMPAEQATAPAAP